MSRLFRNTFLLLFPIAVFAQKTDTVKHPVDTIKNKFAPTGIRFGTDLISIAKSQYVKSFTGWEANAEIDFYRYYLAIDYGTWGRTYFHKPDSAGASSSQYANSGNYYRVGVDVNFLKKDPDKNVFFIGFRYGHSKFKEDFSGIEIDPFTQNPVNLAYQNPNVKAHWLELTSGLRVKMWKFIWMGYTARFKFALKYSNTDELIPSDVPGYGRTDRQIYWGFNYQIFFRVPVRKVR